MAHEDGRRSDQAKDAVRIVLDPFQDRRNACIFSVNPRGEKPGPGHRRALEPGLGRPRYARTVIGPDGWSAEIAIPFKSISFKPDLESLRASTSSGSSPGGRKSSACPAPGPTPFSPIPPRPPRSRDSAKSGKGMGIDLQAVRLGQSGQGPRRGQCDPIGAGRRVRPLQEFHAQFSRGLQLQHRFRRDRGRRAPGQPQPVSPSTSPRSGHFSWEGSEIFNFGTTSPWNGVRLRAVLFDAQDRPLRRRADPDLRDRRQGLRQDRPDDMFRSWTSGRGPMRASACRPRTSSSPASPRASGREQGRGHLHRRRQPYWGRISSLAGFDAVYQTSRLFGDKNFLAGGWFV